MSLSHHISDELLLAYEAGSLAEGWSLAVATHLALCPACRRRARLAAEVGGAALETIETSPVSDAAFDRVMARVAASPQPQAAEKRPPPGATPCLPEPLRSYAGGDVDRIAWKRLGGTALHLPIATGDGKTRARLLKIPAGAPVPAHGHGGMELTVVLAGSLCDGDEVFRRGDIEEADEGIEHQPRAGPEGDCICLVVTDAPLRFKTWLARLAQPFLRI